MEACRKIFIELYYTVSMYLFKELHKWDYGTRTARPQLSRNSASLQTGEIYSSMVTKKDKSYAAIPPWTFGKMFLNFSDITNCLYRQIELSFVYNVFLMLKQCQWFWWKCQYINMWVDAIWRPFTVFQ